MYSDFRAVHCKEIRTIGTRHCERHMTSHDQPLGALNALRAQRRAGFSTRRLSPGVVLLSGPSGLSEENHCLRLSQPRVQCLTCMQCRDPGPGKCHRHNALRRPDQPGTAPPHEVGAVWLPASVAGEAVGNDGGGGRRGGRRERRDGRCAHRGVAPSSPARPGQPYPVRPVESVPGTADTRHQTPWGLRVACCCCGKVRGGGIWGVSDRVCRLGLPCTGSLSIEPGGR